MVMRTTVMCVVLLCVASHSAAQTPPAPKLPHADASLSVGWLNAEVSALSHGMDNWANRRATLTGQAGVYWTDHLKTEVAAERSTRQNVLEGDMVVLSDGRTAWQSRSHDTQDTRLSIGQFYQFGHNAWAHASIGAGISMTWRDVQTSVSPLYVYDNRGQQIVRPGESHRSDDLRTNAFAAAAVKAYVTPRLFVRTDGQLDFRGSLDAVVLRVGFGVDF